MAKTTTQVTVDDSVFQALYSKIGRLAKRKVKVGVLESAGDVEGEDLSLAELLAIHEYGAPAAGIPARAPLRRTFKEPEGEQALLQFLKRTATAIIGDRLSPEDALDALGMWAVARVRARIRAHLSPELKPATIKRKGSSTPLVDTGQLQAAITHEVK